MLPALFLRAAHDRPGGLPHIPYPNRDLIYKRPHPHRVMTSEGGFMFARLLLASALAVGLASAQRGGGGGGGDMGGMGGNGTGGDNSGSMGGGMPRTQRQSRADIIADKLHLNKDQKEQAAKIFAAAQEEAVPLNEQVRTGRSAITTAILQGTSGDDMNKMMAQFTDLMGQKAAVEAKAYGN